MKSVMRVLAVLAGLTVLSTAGCSNNPIAGSAGQDAQDETGSAVPAAGDLINTDDFIQDISGLSKATADAAGSAKFHYRNVILPKQNGVLYWHLAQQCADYDARRLVGWCLARWNLSMPFTLVETADIRKANIVIKFVNTPTVQLKTGAVPWWSNGTMALAYAFPPSESSQCLGLDYQEVMAGEQCRICSTDVPHDSWGGPDGGRKRFMGNLV